MAQPKEKASSIAANTKKVSRKLERLKKMQAKKSFWNVHWQTIAENFLTRKASFTTTQESGAFLNDEIFDGTGPGALMKFASAIVGMLWPNGARSFVLVPPRGIKETEEVKKYFDTATEIMADEMDKPRAGLQVALDEYMIDQGGFGTSGVSVMPGKRSKLSYKAENVKFMCIDEGPDGFVDTVYIEFEWEISKAVKQYGLESLHPETQKLFREGKEDQLIKILFCVEPRMDRDPKKEGIFGMEFESMHIEIEKKHLIRESGFNDLPTKVGRFRKALGEIYGRSPAMEALPDVQEINAILEGVTIAIEKKLEPPLAVFDDGMLGANSIDTSAGAVSVLNISERAGQMTNPIQPLYTVEEISDAVGLIERLENSISNHFMLDRLLDFNNENEMTLGEVNVRNRLRGFLIGSIFARQIAEVFSPLIERSFNLLFEMGQLGVIDGSPEHKKLMAEGEDDILIIPQAIAKLMTKNRTEPPFKIKYISPAARILQSEQAQGIIQAWDFAVNISQVNPEAQDNLDADESIKELGFVWGVPSKVLTSAEKKEQIRTGRRQAMEQQQMVDGAPKVADAVKKAAEAGSYGLMGKRGNGKRQKSAA